MQRMLKMVSQKGCLLIPKHRHDFKRQLIWNSMSIQAYFLEEYRSPTVALHHRNPFLSILLVQHLAEPRPALLQSPLTILQSLVKWRQAWNIWSPHYDIIRMCRCNVTMSVSFVTQSEVWKKVLFLYRIKCAKEYLLVSALNDGEALSTLST